MPKKTLFLLDGMALAYRAYFAFIANPLRNSKGENTSAVYGFTNTLMKILSDEKPDYVAVAFDTPQPTFRHKAFSDYKATRQKMPEDMVPQLPLLKEIAVGLGVPVIEAPGFEADDIIGTLAQQAHRHNVETYLVTGDKDFMQLVGHGVTMYNPLKKGVEKELIDSDAVRLRFGVGPEHVTDVLGLMGDTADNIPGVKGIGEKTAVKLIAQFGSIGNLYERIDEVPGKLKEKLLRDKENALLSKQLATIDTNVPVETNVKALIRTAPNASVLVPIMERLEFNSLIQRLGLSVEESPEAPADRRSPHQYLLVRTKADLKNLLSRLEKTTFLAIGTQTTSPDAFRAELLGLAISWKPQTGYYVALQEERARLDMLEGLKPVLENPSIAKLGHNIKYDLLVLRQYGIQLRGVGFDTMIASHLIHGEQSATLGAMAQRHLHWDRAPAGLHDPPLEGAAPEELTERACEEVDCIVRLKPALSTILTENRSEQLFTTIELPLVEVLAEIERNGVWLDLKILSDMSREFGDQIDALEKRIFKEAGTEFNMNSPQQLGEILFDKMQIHKVAGIDRPKRTGKTGQYATDVKILEQYRSLPIIDAILAFRQLSKLKSTYVDGLPPLIHPATGRIHSTFSQTVASTGRLSSSNPNFQNIPIRTDLGKEIRKAFRAQEKGWCLLSADYSQIELRVMAHMSGDEGLIEAFAQDADIHTSTAMKVFNVSDSRVTPDLRRKAKDINFGIMYGISPFGLASRIGLNQAEAREFIANYFATFPRVKAFIERTIEEGRKNGYVQTLFGRRRYLPDLQSKNYTVRQMAERAATNTPIQGTAAELIKIAMINIHNRLRRSRLAARMILQVHDELVFEVRRDDAAALKSIVQSEMAEAADLKVSLKVDVGIGDNWLETK